MPPHGKARIHSPGIGILNQGVVLYISEDENILFYEVKEMIDDDSKGLECSKHIQFKPVNTDPEAVYARVQYRIREAEWRNAKDGVSRWWQYVSIAVSISFLALLSYQFLYHPEAADTVKASPPPPVIYLETVALPGAKTCITLPDSSIVWLNSMASLRYPQQFTGTSRLVELKGEALFDIRKDTVSPFVVSTDGMHIEVTGTVFNVYSGLTPGLCTEVTLIKGSVSLYKDGNDAPPTVLMPNQQALFDKESGNIRVARVNASAYSSWVTRKFIFDRTSMEDIARELGRAFNVKIHIHNDSIRNMQINAHFTHGETLDKILSILQIPANYAYRKEGGDIHLK
ncbi:MAG: DUF4974 domain-containing protein [Tannerellaceae bacterium]|nr:DUF4974 domain-containing protein [Tannerellaceae bacterium]